MLRRLGLAALVLTCLEAGARPGPSGAHDELARGLSAIQSLTGCYLVDYSYVETESLQPGYALDRRVYDVNRDKSVKEWIYAEVVTPRRIQLRRVLFATDLRGAVRAGSELQHQTEDWEYGAPFLYDFAAPSTWVVRDLRSTPDLWTRRITNLDEGLRYQCAASWRTDTAYAEWTCANYAPLPGRESRDMGRRDYDALERRTRIVAYGSSWLERQDNVKTVHRDGTRQPLARETGKNWYVRLPESECAGAKEFARPRQAFWTLVREVWDGILTGDGPFVERMPAGQPPRFMKMYAIEQDYLGRDLSDPALREAARRRVLDLIEEYRAR